MTFLAQELLTACAFFTILDNIYTVAPRTVKKQSLYLASLSYTIIYFNPLPKNYIMVKKDS